MEQQNEPLGFVNFNLLFYFPSFCFLEPSGQFIVFHFYNGMLIQTSLKSETSCTKRKSFVEDNGHKVAGRGQALAIAYKVLKPTQRSQSLTST